MASSTKREELVRLATELQQRYYELLPDWFVYTDTEHQHLKNKIGYALFGPLEEKQVAYNENQLRAIDVIYQKIIKFTTCPNNSVHLSILYNVIFHNDGSKKSKPNDTAESQESNVIQALPVFRIRRYKNGFYDTCYLEINGRMYENWDDYKNNNQLPQCVMVIPKNGFYQTDTTRKVTKLHSSVWVEIVDSPACKTSRKVFKAMDIASTVLSVGGTIGIGAASLLTPVGPVVAAAGLVSSGISGIWTVGRCSQQLADRSKHKESIVDKNAIPAWLGIAGSTLGMGANTGAVLLTRSIATGARASTAARVAFNTVVIGNLTVNGIGVAYQGSCLIGKYREKGEIDITDALLFASHVLFFSNAVMNVKLAGELIRSSQGSVVDQFENNMRSSRLSQEYNRANSGNVNGNDLGIVRGVTIVQSMKDLIGGIRNIGFGTCFSKINIGSLTLLDPALFVGFLLLGENFVAPVFEQSTTLVRKGMNRNLLGCLSQLLRSFSSGNRTLSTTLPAASEFNEIIQELSCASDAKSILQVLFKIGGTIAINLDDPNKFLVDAVRFVWNYVKVNIHEYKTNTCDYFEGTPIHGIVIRITTAIEENMDSMLDVLFTAFYSYMMKNRSVCVY